MVANAASTHTQRWSRAMAERGHTVAVFSVRHNPIEGVEVVSTIPHNHNTRSTSAIAAGYIKLRRTLGPKLKAFQPDLVHVHYASTNGYITALVGTRPTLLTVWGTDVVPRPGKNLSALQRHRVRRAIAHADIVTSTSEFMANHVRNVAEPKRMELVPFGVDLAQFKPTPAPRSKTVLVAKSLEPRYGIGFVITAMEIVSKSMPGARLVIAGDGSLRSQLEETAAASPAHVSFRGHVPHDDLAAAIASADIVVNPTVVDESFGVVVLEAQAMGRPVVATRVGAVPTVCIEDETAILVEPSNPRAMATAILEVLRGERLQQAGAAGPAFVRQGFDWNRSITEMEHLYEDLVS